MYIYEVEECINGNSVYIRITLHVMRDIFELDTGWPSAFDCTTSGYRLKRMIIFGLLV